MPDVPGRQDCYNKAICGNTVEGNWRQVVGWDKRRSQGGQNALRRRRETGVQACDACGVTPAGQAALAAVGIL